MLVGSLWRFNWWAFLLTIVHWWSLCMWSQRWICRLLTWRKLLCLWSNEIAKCGLKSRRSGKAQRLKRLTRKSISKILAQRQPYPKLYQQSRWQIYLQFRWRRPGMQWLRRLITVYKRLLSWFLRTRLEFTMWCYMLCTAQARQAWSCLYLPLSCICLLDCVLKVACSLGKSCLGQERTVWLRQCSWLWLYRRLCRWGRLVCFSTTRPASRQMYCGLLQQGWSSLHRRW